MSMAICFFRATRSWYSCSSRSACAFRRAGVVFTRSSNSANRRSWRKKNKAEKKWGNAQNVWDYEKNFLAWLLLVSERGACLRAPPTVCVHTARVGWGFTGFTSRGRPAVCVPSVRAYTYHHSEASSLSNSRLPTREPRPPEQSLRRRTNPSTNSNCPSRPTDVGGHGTTTVRMSTRSS